MVAGVEGMRLTSTLAILVRSPAYTTQQLPARSNESLRSSSTATLRVVSRRNSSVEKSAKVGAITVSSSSRSRPGQSCQTCPYVPLHSSRKRPNTPARLPRSSVSGNRFSLRELARLPRCGPPTASFCSTQRSTRRAWRRPWVIEILARLQMSVTTRTNYRSFG